MPRGKILTAAMERAMREDTASEKDIALERKALALVGDGVGAGVLTNIDGDSELMLTEDTVAVFWKRYQTGYDFSVFQITSDTPTHDDFVEAGEAFKAQFAADRPFLAHFVAVAFQLLEAGKSYSEIRDVINSQANTPAGPEACERWARLFPPLHSL